jgi:hypothetical protein
MGLDFGSELAVVTAIGTWALVVGTLYLMWWQTRQGQRLNSGNAVITLRERFDGDRMRKARRHLAEHLMNRQYEDIASMEVVTFFELLGALTHEGLLEERLVWEAFGTWINAYYKGLSTPVDLIRKVREDLKDPLVFHEFEWLERRVEALDVTLLGREHAAEAEDALEVQRMLQREASLSDL